MAGVVENSARHRIASETAAVRLRLLEDNLAPVALLRPFFA
jgi:hypothetical protein